MKTLRLLPFFLGALLFAQQRPATPADVIQQSTFSTCSATGGPAVFVGLNPAVRIRLTFWVDGTNFTAASVGIQGAPATNATTTNPGTPGAWTSSTAITLVEGSVSPLANPIASAAQGTIVVSTYYPFVRVLCNSATGSGGTIFFTLSGVDGTSTALSPGGSVGPSPPATTVNQGTQGTQGWFSMPVLPPGTSGSTTVLTYYLPAPYFSNATPTGNTFVNIKATAGNVWGYDIVNPNTSVCWLQFYNSTGPSLGSGIAWAVPVLASGGIAKTLPSPINLSTAISIATTTTATGSTTCTTGMGVTIYDQ